MLVLRSVAPNGCKQTGVANFSVGSALSTSSVLEFNFGFPARSRNFLMRNLKAEFSRGVGLQVLALYSPFLCAVFSVFL